MPYTEYTRENTLKIAEKNMERQFQDLVSSTTFFPNFIVLLKGLEGMFTEIWSTVTGAITVAVVVRMWLE